MDLESYFLSEFVGREFSYLEFITDFEKFQKDTVSIFSKTNSCTLVSHNKNLKQTQIDQSVVEDCIYKSVTFKCHHAGIIKSRGKSDKKKQLR